jgi:D-alanyl-D-alanine carboxypeptidase
MNKRLAPFLLLLNVATAQAQVNEAGFAKLDKYLESQITQKKTPGLSVAVVQKGRVVYAKGFGKANLENDVEANASTVYRIASVTKQFTATMIMQLANEGKLKLDDPFQTILPGMPKAWSKVTIKNLLNHTSGIKSYTDVPSIIEFDLMKPSSPAGIIKKVINSKLDFEPGTSWKYNNSGYVLLGMIIEKLDNKPYAEALKSRILTPLGMSQTYFVNEKAIVPHRAQGYSSIKGGFEHANYMSMDWPYAAGSIESTVLDMAKWDEALYGNKILPQALLKEMWTKTKISGKIEKDYGYGWEIGSLNGTPIIEHNGGIYGFSAEIKRAPSKGITVIILTNVDQGIDPTSVTTEVMVTMEPSLKAQELVAEKDKDLAKTSTDRKIFQSIIDGTFDRETLNSEFAKVLTPAALVDAKKQLSVLGDITKFEFVKEIEDGDTISRLYKVSLGSTDVKYMISKDPKGQISALGIRP